MSVCAVTDPLCGSLIYRCWEVRTCITSEVFDQSSVPFDHTKIVDRCGLLDLHIQNHIACMCLSGEVGLLFNLLLPPLSPLHSPLFPLYPLAAIYSVDLMSGEVECYLLCMQAALACVYQKCGIPRYVEVVQVVSF